MPIGPSATAAADATDKNGDVQADERPPRGQRRHVARNERAVPRGGIIAPPRQSHHARGRDAALPGRVVYGSTYTSSVFKECGRRTRAHTRGGEARFLPAYKCQPACGHSIYLYCQKYCTRIIPSCEIDICESVMTEPRIRKKLNVQNKNVIHPSCGRECVCPDRSMRGILSFGAPRALESASGYLRAPTR